MAQASPSQGERDPIENIDDIVEETSLTPREAQVYVLKELGYSHSEAADRLDITPSAVSQYVRRIKNRVQEAGGTLQRVDLGAIYPDIEYAPPEDPSEKIDVDALMDQVSG